MGVKEHDTALDALARAESALRDARNELERGDVLEAAARSGVDEEALMAFVETIGDVLGDRPLTVEMARRAALIAAAGQAWENEIGPLLTSAQVRELLGDVSRQRVDELLRAHRLIGLRDGSGRRRFPSFQFRDGKPLDLLIDAYWTVAAATVSDWTAASWCVALDEALEGRSPAQWAREDGDPERLARIAGQDAARFAR